MRNSRSWNVKLWDIHYYTILGFLTTINSCYPFFVYSSSWLLLRYCCYSTRAWWTFFLSFATFPWFNSCIYDSKYMYLCLLHYIAGGACAPPTPCLQTWLVTITTWRTLRHNQLMTRANSWGDIVWVNQPLLRKCYNVPGMTPRQLALTEGRSWLSHPSLTVALCPGRERFLANHDYQPLDYPLRLFLTDNIECHSDR